MGSAALRMRMHPADDSADDDATTAPDLEGVVERAVIADDLYDDQDDEESDAPLATWHCVPIGTR